jgi:acyl-CoA synthetase (AMP-forming)/AMP-acid ligase II
MAADGIPERVLVGSSEDGYRADDLAARAGRIGGWLATQPGERLALVDLNSEAVPLALYGAALAGRAFVPINYRLTDDQLRALVQRTAPAVVVVGEGVAERLGPVEGVNVIGRDEFLAISADDSHEAADPYSGDPESIAVLLYTSGTTGEPKAAVLRHRNLAAYILTTVDFGSADPEEAALVSVPPYHIAGMSAVLSSTYAGRRVVYMESFSPEGWVALARDESISHAMVVPTMLHRILDVLEAQGETLPALRNLSYGGGPMPVSVIERALNVLPHVNFVNAYGLTETSSTIALLGPEDHRQAIASTDPAERARLGSVGRPLPSVTVSIRDPDGHELPPGERGEIWVQGDQVSGEYLGRNGAGDGWFRTRDAGHLDAEGFLFVHGRLDDVIVRGGENLSPGEIEEALLEHPGVDSAAVVGIPDTDWGEKVVAAVTCGAGTIITEDELKDFVRQRLRSTKTPERIQIREQLPYNETGKLLRRVLRDELAAEFTPA